MTKLGAALLILACASSTASALELRNVRDATVYCHAVVRYIDSDSDVAFGELLFYSKRAGRGVHLEATESYIAIFPEGFRVRSLMPTTVRYECASKSRA